MENFNSKYLLEGFFAKAQSIYERINNKIVISKKAENYFNSEFSFSLIQLTFFSYFFLLYFNRSLDLCRRENEKFRIRK